MVDILLASYNGERYIKEQIESILAQDYQNFQLFIRDDGSTDGTLEIIKEYTSKYPDKIRLIEDDVRCGSAVKNFMQLTKYATADYVMYSDQDDYWFPNKISVSLKRIQMIENKIGKDKPVLVFAEYKAVDQELKEIPNSIEGSQIEKKNLQLNQLLVQNCVNGCLMMVNKALYSISGEYDRGILMHDWWMALIAATMGKISHINETVMFYRQHGDNAVGNVNVKRWDYRIKKFLDKDTKNAKYEYWRQADLFWNRYKNIMPQESKQTVYDFLMIHKEKLKVKRIQKLIKGGYLKSDFVRVVGQIWYI